MISTKSPLIFSLVIQTSVTLFFSVLFLILSPIHAYSYLSGACVFIIANAYFVHYAYRYRGVELSRWIAHSFKWGEAGKLSLSALLFALVFQLIKPLNVGFVFFGFSCMMCLQWLIAYWVVNKPE